MTTTTWRRKRNRLETENYVGNGACIVRREEDLNDMAMYIAANPVRAGLADYLHGGVLLQRAVDGDLKVAATTPYGALAYDGSIAPRERREL